MKKRCIVCGRPFDQILASQETCTGTCERMRPTLTPSAAPEPEPETASQRPPAAEPLWRTCTHKGCGVDFRLERKRGRPPVKCPQHRKTAA